MEYDEEKPISRLLGRYEEWMTGEMQAATEAEALGYMVRAFVMATMPHSKPKSSTFERDNGFYSMAIMAHPKIGLPYGSIPRVLMSWLTTEALRTGSRELILGDSLSAFMRELAIVPTGGRWGTITRLKDQVRRLFTCNISCVYDDPRWESIVNIRPVEKAFLWWDPVDHKQTSLWKSSVLLDESFFKEIKGSSIVFKMDTLKYLRNSSMAIDIYLWSTYRNSYAKKPAIIKWEALQQQFGAGYPTTTRGLLDFKRNFIKALKKVGSVYPEVNKFKIDTDHMVFIPGYSDVPKKFIRVHESQKLD
jgi:hypothetical protein